MQATIRDIAGWCNSLKIEQENTCLLTGVSIDTRRISSGQLFVPLAGERSDGHDHIEAAIAAGAVASLWERSKPLPSGVEIPLIIVEDAVAALQALAAGYLERLQAKVVGITGSNGKTTTKDLVAAVLATKFVVHKTEGNYNNHLGLPLTILNAPVDTDVLVLEMGMSERGEISFLSKLAKPDVTVITNVGESHLLQLGSRRNIARAKLEIVEGMKAGGTLVYYGEEPLLREELAVIMQGKSESIFPDGLQLLTYGETESCDLIAQEIKLTDASTSFTVNESAQSEQQTTYELPIPGRHNAVNALAAIAIGRILGLSDVEIATGLQAVKLTSMRIERSRANNGAVILNDAYNASPTSVKAAIELVAELKGYHRKWIVLGDMLELGPDEEQFHRDIGAALQPSKADRVLLYGSLSIHTANEASGKYAPECVQHFTEKQELTTLLLQELEPEDLVLVKASRGMKMEEVVAALQSGLKG